MVISKAGEIRPLLRETRGADSIY